jgi:hypothetical protein
MKANSIKQLSDTLKARGGWGDVKPNEVGELIEELTSGSKKGFETPNRLKKGDVFYQLLGVKKRPVVVIGSNSEVAFGIPLSTTLDELFMMEGNSRFFGNSYFTNQLVSAKLEYVKENFVGVYDNPKVVREATLKIKLIINSI